MGYVYHQMSGTLLVASLWLYCMERLQLLLHWSSRQARCRLQTRPQAGSPVAVIIQIPADPRWHVESNQVEQNQHICIENPH